MSSRHHRMRRQIDRLREELRVARVADLVAGEALRSQFVLEDRLIEIVAELVEGLELADNDLTNLCQMLAEALARETLALQRLAS